MPPCDTCLCVWTLELRAFELKGPARRSSAILPSLQTPAHCTQETAAEYIRCSRRPPELPAGCCAPSSTSSWGQRSYAFRAAGTVVGAVVGLLSGFINENGLMQGTLVGAISGALVSVELADSLVRIWCCSACSMDTRINRTRLVLRNLVVNRVLRGSVFPTIRSALDSQMDALQPQPGRGDRGDMFEPGFPVKIVRRATVESLPVTKLTEETAGQQATCPICLHEFQNGESIRRLPACCHFFHLVCIDSWLLWNAQCPMCRHAVY